jgi:hypothetical protein
MRIKKQPVFRLRFGFTAQDGRSYEAVVTTHDLRPFTDPDGELILYIPEGPAYNVLLDQLVGKPVVDRDGYFQARNAWATLWVLIGPGLTVFGHAIGAALF